MFGKRVSEYLAFLKVPLILVAAMGLLRLALSLAGLPVTTVRWFSMNLVAWACVIWYGVAVYKKGFGSYKHLLPMGFFLMAVFQAVAVLGIALAMAGLQNVFAAPEFSVPGSGQGVHMLAHLTIGIIVPTLLTWGVACLVMLITKAVSPRRAA
jgi:hypothetical protein